MKNYYVYTLYEIGLYVLVIDGGHFSLVFESVLMRDFSIQAIPYASVMMLLNVKAFLLNQLKAGTVTNKNVAFLKFKTSG